MRTLKIGCIFQHDAVQHRRARMPASLLDGSGAHTFWPPIPSTTLPVRLSTTLACSSPPRMLSTILPNVPQRVRARTHRPFSRHPQAKPPSRPVLVKPWTGLTGQKGSIRDVRAMVSAPSPPAAIPVRVTPPLVPGGTFRRVGEVIKRGWFLDRIPSSLEKVSAATEA
jgi:hypothetical protein